jgi:hypothetical protein
MGAPGAGGLKAPVGQQSDLGKLYTNSWRHLRQGMMMHLFNLSGYNYKVVLRFFFPVCIVFTKFLGLRVALIIMKPNNVTQV